MKAKRYIALLLALSMLLALLSGCGKKDDGKAENTPEKMPKSHGGQRKAVLKALSRV